MGRAPCCDKANVKKGPWSPEEDAKLKDFINKYGTAGNWISLPLKAGLKRCGKSCRLRWLNYLRPNIKHGEFSQQEDSIICNLYATIGSRWSIIAGQLPGRTDNDIKNYWNTKLKKKLLASLQPKSLPQYNSSLYYTNQPSSDQYPFSTPQNYFVNYYCSSNMNNINIPFYYNQSGGQEDVQYCSSNMLMFGGGKEASCSSSDSYGAGNNQVKREQIGSSSSSYQGGFMIDGHTTTFLDHRGVVDYNLQLQYELGEVKEELITSGNNNNSMNLLVDENKIQEKEERDVNVMYYY